MKNRNSDASTALDLDAPIETTGAEIAPGWYPALFVGFGSEIVFFHDEESGADKPRLDAQFLVNAKGEMVQLTTLVSPPTGGEVHRKSKLFSLLKAIASSNGELWDGAANRIKAGVTLRSFTMKPVHVQVTRTPKGFDQIADYQPVRAKVTYPTADDLAEMPPF